MAKYAVVPSKRTPRGAQGYVSKSGKLVFVPLNGDEIETPEDLSAHVGSDLLCSDAGAKKKPAKKVEPVAVSTPEPAPEPVRARTGEGRFQADDPTTPENEAWQGGESPRAKKKLARAAAKRAAKKAADGDADDTKSDD